MKKFLLLLFFCPSSICFSQFETGFELSGFQNWRGIKETKNAALITKVSTGNLHYIPGNADNSFQIKLSNSRDFDTGNSVFNSIEFISCNTWGFFSADFGYSEFLFEDVDSKEFFTYVSFDTFLSPKVYLGYDFNDGDGFLLRASISQALSLDEQKINFETGFYNNFGNSILGSSGLYSGFVKASIYIKANLNITVVPYFTYSAALSNQAERSIKNRSEGGVIGSSNGGIHVNLSL